MVLSRDGDVGGLVLDDDNDDDDEGHSNRPIAVEAPRAYFRPSLWFVRGEQKEPGERLSIALAWRLGNRGTAAARELDNIR